jgi:Amt family ammonium transporter
MPALAIRLVAGVFCYWMVARVKAGCGYDDSLDAFLTHRAGGTLGRTDWVFRGQLVNQSLRIPKGNVLAPACWKETYINC